MGRYTDLAIRYVQCMLIHIAGCDTYFDIMINFKTIYKNLVFVLISCFDNKSTNYSLSNHVWYLKLILEVHQFHWLNIYKNNITFSYCQMSINKLVTNSCVVHQEHWLKIHLKNHHMYIIINCWKSVTKLSLQKKTINPQFVSKFQIL